MQSVFHLYILTPNSRYLFRAGVSLNINSFICTKLDTQLYQLLLKKIVLSAYIEQTCRDPDNIFCKRSKSRMFLPSNQELRKEQRKTNM